MKHLTVLLGLLLGTLAVLGQQFVGQGPYPTPVGQMTGIATPQTYGAKGDGVADDTTALQSAIYYTALSNGIPRKLWLPEGTYKISTTLNIPTNSHLEIYGSGADSGFNINQSRTRIVQTATTSALQFLGTAAGQNLRRLSIHDLAIIGPTNLSTGAAIWLGQTNQADYGSVQGALIENVAIAGFANGVELHDTVTVVMESVHSMFNTNAAFALYRSDSCTLRDCWGGWDPVVPANVQQTCIIDVANVPNNSGSGLGVSIIGGEWGNCWRFLYADGCTLTSLSCNHESLYTTLGICLFTNQCQYTESGGRWGSLTNTTAPVWRVCNNPGGQYNSGIQILNPTIPYQGYLVSVEGPPFNDMPKLTTIDFAGYTNMVYRSTIGGAVTTAFVGSSSLADKNQVGLWTQKQTMYGAGGTVPAMRIQNGSPNGTIEFGADSGALTLTANTLKQGTVSFPPYGSTAYTTAAFQVLGDVTGDYLDLGTGAGLNTVNVMRFAAGGSIRWQLNGSDGSLQSLGGGLTAAAVSLNSLTISSNTFPAVGARFVNLGNGGAVLWNSNGVHGYWIGTNVLAGTAFTNVAW